MICTGERLPHQLLRNALKDTLSASSVAAPRECYEPENKRKYTELGRQRMSDDLMELNDTELNYIYFKRDSGKLLDYSLLARMISNERAF